MVKSTNLRQSERSYKTSTGIFEKTIMDFSVLNAKEFHEVQDILKKKQKQLKSVGKGNRPNAADPLSDEERHRHFYSHGALGIHSPRALLNTLWMNNCTFFGMRPGKEQRDLCWIRRETASSSSTKKDKQKRVPVKTLEISERRNLKCTKTRAMQTAAPSMPTWPTKITGPLP